MDGILIVDKPTGPTSADIVRSIKRTLRTKVGHLGTLDPFASGVLPICLGEGTKLAQFLNLADKAYEGTIQLGTKTDTGDLTGQPVVEETPPSAMPSDAVLAQVTAKFLGDQQQIPPMYSAIKKAGTPLYKLARAGVSVEREPRPIRIDRFVLTSHSPGVLGFEVDCSKGTYIRVLAEDVAVALGTVGHLSSLRRTRFGAFRIDQAIAAPLIDASTAALALLDPREALDGLREIFVDKATEHRIRCGHIAVLERLGLETIAGAVKLIGDAGQLVAVIQPQPSGQWAYARVFQAVPAADESSRSRASSP